MREDWLVSTNMGKFHFSYHDYDRMCDCVMKHLNGEVYVNDRKVESWGQTWAYSDKMKSFIEWKMKYPHWYIKKSKDSYSIRLIV